MLAWPQSGLAYQQLEVLVRSAIQIQSPPVPAYRLRQQVTELAQDGDRLDAVGMAAQSAELPLLLTLDRASNGQATQQIQLLPHSRVRIIQVESLPNGDKRIRLAIEQGQAKLRLNPMPIRQAPPAVQPCHVNRFAVVFRWMRSCAPTSGVYPWYLNGLRAKHLIWRRSAAVEWVA